MPKLKLSGLGFNFLCELLFLIFLLVFSMAVVVVGVEAVVLVGGVVVAEMVWVYGCSGSNYL